MYGLGILKGLGVTIRHFIDTYKNDVFYGFNKGKPAEEFGVRQGTKSEGIYTVQYPDEKVAVPERFRFTPFLVVNDADHPDAPGEDWCTSCGICSKVCPPQCIWIVRGTDPATGRPVPQPEAFFIDIDICMNCGFCAEFCPFDAIKMDHDYEMSNYDRTSVNIHDKERLSKPFSYYRSIAPTTAEEEADARGGWEHTDVIKEKKKAEAAAAKAAAAAAPKPAAVPVAEATADAAPVAEAVTAPAPEASADDEEQKKAERLAKREAALARKKAKGE
ncbi:MAG: 4Fe-4S binding protein [Anaerolineae bacterium]|jgi:NADH-quinone oxidoreductase subunit I|nr:4Fe-4S binding protein [Anaerolineae bacterium]